MLYTPDHTLVWNGIAQQGTVKQVWNSFPYYILKINPTKCFGKIEIQICYTTSNNTDQYDAVTFTWYKKIENGQLFQRKSWIQHSIEKPDENCTEDNNGNITCCPRFPAGDEQFERDISEYIGIYASSNDENFKLLRLGPKRRMNTCTIKLKKWKEIKDNPSINISADCIKNNTETFFPLLLRMWIRELFIMQICVLIFFFYFVSYTRTILIT